MENVAVEQTRKGYIKKFRWCQVVLTVLAVVLWVDYTFVYQHWFPIFLIVLNCIGMLLCELGKDIVKNLPDHEIRKL